MMARKNFRTLGLIAVLAILIIFTFMNCYVYAQPETARSLSKRMSGKFGRGLVNMATGWGEMIRCPLEVGRERGPLLACTWGPLKGIGMTFFRTVGGVFETALFFYPLPNNYAPYFDSEFVFSKPVAEKAPPELPGEWALD